jgi:putative FmdB family regulatory protein
MMPIYEYQCADCNRRVSIFFRSMSTTVDPRCPHCDGSNLRRLFSRVVVRRGGSRPDPAGEPAMDDAGFGGGDLDAADGFDMDPFGGGPPGVDEDADPREIAGWTRRMSAQMGEPLDADLDRALSDIEGGADPEEVMDRLEETEPSGPDD